MGSEAEEWWKLIDLGARIFLGPRPSPQADPRPSLDPAVFKLLCENRRLATENRELHALLDDFTKTITDLSGMGPTLKEFVENVGFLVTAHSRNLDENAKLKQELDDARGENATKHLLIDDMSVRIEALEREVASARENADRAAALERELVTVREKAAMVATLEHDLAEARRGSTEVYHPSWLADFRLLVHPRMLHHIRDLLGSSASSAMNKSIEKSLQAMLRATELGMLVLDGTAQDVIEKLANSKLITPDRYSRRTLSWLARRSPMVNTRAGTEGSLYQVYLDWLIRPPQTCLDHFRVSRAAAYSVQ